MTVTKKTKAVTPKAKAAKVAVTATMHAMATTNAYAAAKKAKNSNLSQTNNAFQAPTEPVVHEVLVPETITVADLAHKMAVKRRRSG